jgi:hypothetical protein
MLKPSRSTLSRKSPSSWPWGGEGDRVDDDVDVVPEVVQMLEHCLDLLVPAHIARNNDLGVHFGRELCDPSHEFFILRGKGQFRALSTKGPCDPPRQWNGGWRGRR